MGDAADIMLALQYALSPFFFNPLKLLLQLTLGSPYTRAYHHFRNNHSLPLNIVVHLFGVVHILIANFAVLSLVDDAIVAVAGFNVGISLATAVAWASLLLFCTSPAPLAVRCTAVAAITAAYQARTTWPPMWKALTVNIPPTDSC